MGIASTEHVPCWGEVRRQDIATSPTEAPDDSGRATTSFSRTPSE